MKTTMLSAVILILSFFGIADAWYLTQSAYANSPLTCDISGLDGCNKVAQSAYSHLFGLPLAFYGVFFFAFLFVLAAVSLFSARRVVYFCLNVLGIVGLVASFIFIGIQLGLIGAICIYCFASAFLSFGIFACTTVLWNRVRKNDREPAVLPWETPPVLP